MAAAAVKVTVLAGMSALSFVAGFVTAAACASGFGMSCGGSEATVTGLIISGSFAVTLTIGETVGGGGRGGSESSRRGAFCAMAAISGVGILGAGVAKTGG